MEAERDTIDRYVAAFLAERVGEMVDARITGVTNFGFFATVEGIGGDGLMPVRDLGGEYFRFDEAARTLIGEQSGDVFALGQRLQLRLAEANPVSGALRFELPEGKGGRADPRGRGAAARVEAARPACQHPASGQAEVAMSGCSGRGDGRGARGRTSCGISPARARRRRSARSPMIPTRDGWRACAHAPAQFGRMRDFGAIASRRPDVLSRRGARCDAFRWRMRRRGRSARSFGGRRRGGRGDRGAGLQRCASARGEGQPRLRLQPVAQLRAHQRARRPDAALALRRPATRHSALSAIILLVEP